MVIRQIELRRFKCWRSLSLEFSPGLNVIFGSNEAGKSTLRQALMAAFFGNPASQSETVERWTSWGEHEPCELKLEYVNQAGQVCQLRKDFAGRKVFLVTEGESFRTAKAIQQEVADDLGIAGEEFYALCASLDSKTLADLGGARRQVGKMLAGLMTGTENGSDALQAIKRLEEALKDLNKGMVSPSKVLGPLKETKERLARFTAEHRQLEGNLAAKQEREVTLERLMETLREDEQKIKDHDLVLAANRKMQEAQKRREGLLQQDAKFEQARAQHERLAEELKSLSALTQADTVSALTAGDLAQLRELITAETQNAAALQTVAAAPSGQKSHRWFWILGGGLAATGLAAARQWPGLGWSALAIGLALLGLAWQRRSGAQTRQRAWEASRDEVQAQSGVLAEKRRFWEIRLGLNLEAVLHAWPESQQRLAQKNALERRLRESEPLDEESWSTVRRELRNLQDLLDDPGVRAYLLPPLEMARLERERAALGAKVEDQRRQRDRLQVLLDHDPVHQDLLTELDERMAEAGEKLVFLEQQARVGQLALEALEQARRATLHPARQILEAEAGRLLSEISAGRYTQISVNDEDLACRVLIPEINRWEDPAALSTGTFDQFYLSLRLALGDLLAGGKKPPLLLDDPFLTFDAQRQARFWQWLKKHARQQQVLFFTCRREYDEKADKVIDLDAYAKKI